jgi:hypothetical protein
MRTATSLLPLLLLLSMGCYNSVNLSDAGLTDLVDAEGADSAPAAVTSDATPIDAAPPDATPIDAPPVVPTIGCVATEQSGPFTSNYDAGQPATLEVFVTDPGVAVFQDGVLKLIPSPGPAGQYASAHTIAPDNFSRRRVSSEVPRMVNTGRSIDAYMSIYSAIEGGTFLEISQFKNGIRANSWVNQVKTELVNIPFNPVAHRWWQLRENAGTVSFETSANGIDWVALTTTPTPAWYNNAHLAFELYMDRSTMSTDLGQVHFDNTYDCKQP